MHAIDRSKSSSNPPNPFTNQRPGKDTLDNDPSDPTRNMRRHDPQGDMSSTQLGVRCRPIDQYRAKQQRQHVRRHPARAKLVATGPCVTSQAHSVSLSSPSWVDGCVNPNPASSITQLFVGVICLSASTGPSVRSVGAAPRPRIGTR